MNSDFEKNVEDITTVGCCLFIAFIGFAALVAVGSLIVTGIGALVRMF